MCELARDGRRERDAHGPHRQAGRICVYPLAFHPHGEVGPRAEVQHLVRACRPAARCRYAMAPDQVDLRVRRQRAPAAQHGEPGLEALHLLTCIPAARSARGIAKELQVPVTQAAALREHFVTGCAFEHVDRNALGHVLDRAGSVFRDRGWRCGSVECEHEYLVRVDRGVAVHRQRRADRRATGIEGVLPASGYEVASDRSQSFAQREAAFQTGGEAALEVIDPVACIRPPATTACLAVDGKGLWQAWVAEGNHRLGETHRDLADVLDHALRREDFDGSSERRPCNAGCTAHGENAQCHASPDRVLMFSQDHATPLVRRRTALTSPRIMSPPQRSPQCR